MSRLILDNRGRTSVKFKINQQENSKRVMETLKLQFKGLWKHKEFLWLIVYLLNLGYSEDDIYYIWSLIYIRNFGDLFDESELKTKYSKIRSVINRNKNPTLFTGNKISFYQDEINYINSLIGPKWIKEYFLVLLGYFKFMGWKDQFVQLSEIPRNTLLTKFTSLNRQGDHETQAIYDFATKNKLWEVSNSGKIRLLFFKETGSVIKEFNTSADLGFICSFVKNEKKCVNCGTFFEYSSKCKRNLCLDCWKKKDKEKRNLLMKKNYNSEKENLITI